MPWKRRCFGRLFVALALLVLVDRPAFISPGRRAKKSATEMQTEHPNRLEGRALMHRRQRSDRYDVVPAALFAGGVVELARPEQAHASGTPVPVAAGDGGGLNVLGIAIGIAIPLIYSYFLQSQQAEVAKTAEAYRRVQDGNGVFSALLPVAVVAGLVVALFTNVGVFINSPGTTAGYVFGFNVVGVAAGGALPAIYAFFLQAQQAEVAQKEEAYREAQSAEGTLGAQFPIAVAAGVSVALITNVGLLLTT